MFTYRASFSVGMTFALWYFALFTIINGADIHPTTLKSSGVNIRTDKMVITLQPLGGFQKTLHQNERLRTYYAPTKFQTTAILFVGMAAKYAENE